MIKNIDFEHLYREHLEQCGRVFKPASEWDAKAQDMRKKVLDSPYTQEFIRRVDVCKTDTILDVGCGPGTIGLSLAHRVRKVVGLDYSQAMLDAMMDNANELGVTHIQPIHASWEDSWESVPTCDITVVSRASIVADMGKALDKLHQHTRKKVYMTHLVGGHFISAEIARLLGKEDQCFPDHLYIIQILAQRSIYPTVDYIVSPSRLAGCKTEQEFIERVAWSLGELTETERATLSHWYRRDPSYAQQGGQPMRWAFLSWDVPKRSLHE